MRGIPDISLAGNHYVIRDGGKWIGVDGTSAASPTFAGMVSILNAKLESRNASSGGGGAEDVAGIRHRECSADTGRHCVFSDCDFGGFSGAECIRYKCICPTGFCAVNGVCEPVDAPD